MNNNGNNQGMNVDDYENMAVNRSHTAKRVAAGAGAFVAGGAVAGGVAYAASGSAAVPEVDQDIVSTEDVLHGAESGADQPKVVEETHTVVKEVHVTAPEAHEEVPEEVVSEEDSSTHWDTTKNIYENGELRGSIVSGEVDGHKAVIIDSNGDSLADTYAVDYNDDGIFQDDEIEELAPEEQVSIDSIETKHVENDIIIGSMGEEPGIGGEEPIHNDFTDEKTGETYRGDYAENNRDYNNHAGLEDVHDTADGHHAAPEEYHGYEEEHHGFEDGHHDTIEPYTDGGDSDGYGLDPVYGDAEHVPGHGDPVVEPIGGHEVYHNDDIIEPYDDTVEPYDGYDDPDDGTVEPYDGSDDPDDGSDDPDDGYDDPDDGYDDPDDGYDDTDIDGLADESQYDEYDYGMDSVDDGMDHIGGEVIIG